jgi:HEAT repeat protein
VASHLSPEKGPNAGARGLQLTELEALMDGFDRDPVEHGKQIHERIELDSEAFYASTIEILKGQSDSRGVQYLVSLLVANDYVLRALCDPALSHEQAATVAQAAVRIDAMADVKLARAIAESVETGDVVPVSAAAAGRVLEILADISAGTRLLPSLVKILRHNDPYLRSKAVLLVGRANKSARWTSQRLNDADSRIRANAVESLWGVDNESARELLHNAATDWNNRVAGNALVGLYRLGDCSTIAEIVSMAEHESVIFRATAAWVMGETADPRFLEKLAVLMRETDPVLRKCAFAALRNIKAAVQAAEGEPWLVVGRIPSGEQQRSQRRLYISVASAATDRQQPEILPTQFILSEDGRPVNKYKVADYPLPDTQAVVFVFPRGIENSEAPWRQGAQQCLAWKRTSDFWASLYYVPAGEAEGTNLQHAHLENEPPSYQSNTEAATADLARSPTKFECMDFWRTLSRAIRTADSAIRGKRHIILVNRSKTELTASPELTAALLMKGTLQVVSTCPDPLLEALCMKVNGSFDIAGSEARIPDLIVRAYLRLITRYEITWRPVYPEARELRVRVFTTSGAGEAAIQIAG